MGPVTATEAGGLSYALGQPPVTATVVAILLDGSRLPAFEVQVPTLQAALTLKTFAWADRRERRDAVDVWRLAGAAVESGVTPEAWNGTISLRQAREILRADFARVTGAGPVAATPDPGDRALIVANIMRVIGPPV